MDTFTISGEEHEIVLPKGKKGRKATNFLLKNLGGTESVGIDSIINLLESDEFEQHHMPAILGLKKEYLDEEGTTMELIQALMKVIDSMLKGLDEPEVQTALKNSQTAQEAMK